LSIATYRKKQDCHKYCVFGKEHDKFVRVMPCTIGEPVCFDELSNPEGPFCFVYLIVFRRLSLRLPFTPFERALLTEVNVAPAQLHPNSWAFVRAFAILCHCLGHTPSVDVFLYFFEAKSPGKKLRVSFNGVAGRVLLTLFQQSYKGFKGKFFKVRSNRKDPTLLDGFPLYWPEKPKLKKPRCLEDLPPQELEVFDLLSDLQALFSTVELLKLEFSPKALKGYIGTCLPLFLLFLFTFFCTWVLSWFRLLCVIVFFAGMVLNAEKKRQLAVVALQLKAAPGPSPDDASAPATSAPGPSAPALVEQRQKGVTEAAASEDEDTCSGLVFKRKRKVDVAVPTNSGSDDRALLTGSTLLVPLPLVTLWCRRVRGECLRGQSWCTFC